MTLNTLTLCSYFHDSIAYMHTTYYIDVLIYTYVSTYEQMCVYTHTHISVSLKAFQSSTHPCISNVMLGIKGGLNMCSLNKEISELMHNQEETEFPFQKLKWIQTMVCHHGRIKERDKLVLPGRRWGGTARYLEIGF